MKFIYNIPKEYDVSLDAFIPPLRQRRPSWINNLTPWLDGCKSKKEAIDKLWERFFDKHSYDTARTAKTCPGMVDYFKYSLPLKFPAQFFLEIQEECYRGKCSSDLVKVSHHNPNQAPLLMDDQYKHLAIKFTLPIYYKLSRDSIINYTDPVLYNNGKPSPYIVVPGVQELSSGQLSQLNVICFFPTTPAKYVFDAGTTIAGVQFSNKITKMEYQDMKISSQKLINSNKSYIL